MWATNRTEDWEATSTHPRVMLTGRIASGLPVNQEQSGLGDQAGPKHHPVTQSRSDQFWRANGSIAEIRGHVDPSRAQPTALCLPSFACSEKARTTARNEG